ncbi:MAG: hypothetical protein AMXMBFR58_14240 [Phycisphaerae bacterium]
MAMGQGKAQTKDSPAIYVAAFGKHPGWDDHIEDLGIETDLLAQARRTLYSEAISGNIDSGSWEKLGDDQRLAGFAHDFVWWIGPTGKDPAHVIVGRLWSSRDGKGRSKYPMAVYAQGDGIPLAVMAREVLPALAALERRCIEATTADGVRSAMESTRAELRSRFAAPDAPRQAPQGPAEVLSPSQVGALVDRDELGPRVGAVREGFARAMYAVERDFGAFLPLMGEGRKSKSLSVKPAEARGAHMRVPSLVPQQHEAALVWISLLARRLAEGTSILAVAPRGESFVDIVAGEVGPAQLYSIRASAKGFPLTTDVPYVIDDAFRGRAAQFAAQWSQTAPPVPPPTDKAPAAAKPAAPAQEPAAPKRRFPKLFVLVGGAALVVAGVLSRPLWSTERSAPLVASAPATGSDVQVPPSQGPPGSGQTAPRPTDRPPTDTSSAPASSSSKDAAAEQVPKPDRDESAQRERAEAQEKARQEEADRLAQAARDRAAQEAAQAQRDKEAAEARVRQEEQERLAQAAREQEAREAADKQARLEAEKAQQEIMDRQAREAEAARLAEAERLKAEEASRAADKLKSDIEAAGTLLAGGARLRDEHDGSRTLDRLASEIRSSPGLAVGELEAPARAALAQIGLLEQIDGSSDAAFVLGCATRDDASLAVRLGAAERLAALAWPRTTDEWAQARRIASSIRPAAAAVQGAEEDTGGAAHRLRAATAAMWKARWRAVDPSNLDELVDAMLAMSEMGVDAAALEPAERFNVLVVETRHRARAGGEKLEAVVETFLAGAGSLNDLPEAAAKQVEQVQAAMDARRAAAAAGPPLEQLGPGSLPGGRRWTLSASGDGWAVYAPPPATKASAIEFVLVRTAAGSAWVSTREVSLGLFCAAIDSIGAWSEVSKLGRLEVSESLSRGGPTVWVWTISGKQATGMQPRPGATRIASRGWFDFDNAMAKQAYFDPGSEPAPPTADHPMQYVSPAAALAAARALGCRLPTVEESVGLASTRPASAAPNRRDASWMAANATLVRRGNGRNSTWLDQDIFIPEGEQYPRRDKAQAAVDGDDASVMLRPVNADTTEHVVHDAVGNVAEFVFEDEGAVGAIPADFAGLGDAMQRTSALRVIGASAFSPPEIEPGRAYPVRSTSAAFGYSDVGFRLAFPSQGTGGTRTDDRGIAAATESLQIVR